MVVEEVIRMLINEGYRVRREVPNLGQSTDIVATKNRWLTAIEAKTKDWRRAFLQCRTHELVADYICIAIGTAGVSEKLERAIRLVGYGLIHCPEKSSICQWIVRPKQNRDFWGPQRIQISRIMRTIEYER